MRNSQRYSSLFAAVLLGIAGLTHAQTPAVPTPAEIPNTALPSETPEARSQRMQWWRDARFGMFIHWGAYAVPAGGEWYMSQHHVQMADYEKYAAQFNPVQFDADKIATIAESAGQKYLVITAKHHDGFCMFKTDTTKYNIVDASPWHQDPLAPLSEACAKHHVRFCCYYSIMDWHSPDQIGDKPDGDQPTYNPTSFRSSEHKAAYITYMKAQLKDLITHYHPGLLWFDGGWMKGWTKEDGADLLTYLYTLDPQLIVNDRTNGGGDYGTPEQHIPAKGLNRDWETCMTINDNWGFNKDDTHFKSTETLLHNLIDITSKGGNYLLNVGPTAGGFIPDGEVERLEEVGAWMKVNGQAIYGTGPTAFGSEVGEYSTTKKDKKGEPLFEPKMEWRCTTRPGVIYIHLFKWPAGKFELSDVKGAVAKAYLLADPAKKPLPVTQDGAKVSITLPDTAPDAIASVLVLEIPGK
jgi:alpha-L-fucosidase